VQQRDFIDLISRKRTGLWAGFLRLWLRFASLFFWIGARARLLLYHLGLLPRHRVERPVICVGNLTTGGTGKTPAVAWVVGVLRHAGLKPAIVSRGYGGDERGNDELKVLAELCPGVPHVQNPDRVAGARKAIADGADVIVLDDGFSHLRLRRDLDILLFDALNPFGFGRMLPRGLLREPLSSVRRAKCAIFTHADAATPERLRDLEDTVRCKGFVGPTAHAAHRPVTLVDVLTGQEQSLEVLRGVTVAPFCGIGNPRGFARTLELLGAKLTPLEVLRLDDHAALDSREVQRQVIPFVRACSDVGASIAICTQKDAVKLRAASDLKVTLHAAEMPVLELRVQFDVIRDAEAVKAAILAAAGKGA
jgi:tetraacyldisaccharide 4'-kinase